jgi:curved DNA-binding protein CbpA
MSEIHKALHVLGLESGASQETIQRRYKRLIMVWHPDRFPNDEGKKDAEEELKKINNANDILKKHFATNHRASGCE